MRADRVKQGIIDKISMVLLEAGKPITELEYRQLQSVPVRLQTIRRYFGRWDRLLVLIQHSRPDVWKEITNPPKPAAPKVTPKKTEKVTSFSKASKPKVSVKKEIEDE